MLTQEDLFILKAACKGGKHRREDLKQKVLQEQKEGLPFRKTLIDEGFFSPSDWEEYRKEAAGLYGYPETEEYLKWENILLWKKLNTLYPPEEMERLIRLYEFAITRGESLLTLLLATKVLSEEGAHKLFHIEKQLTLFCTPCNLLFEVIQYIPWRKYPCPFCENMLTGSDSVPRKKETTQKKNWMHQAIPKESISIPTASEGRKILKTWGSFEILDVLGKGGYGLVYRAYDPQKKEEVALKVLTQHQASSRHLPRFQREMDLLKRLDHPGIVKIHGWGTWEGKPYYSMDYIQGTNLWGYVRERGTLSEEEALSLLSDICDAVSCAHSQGVIHRDIKPENLLVDPEGKIHLMDFGLAKDLSDWKLSLTETGFILGTPDFMSPEQVRGEKDNIGDTTDVFALGGLLYFMLTGNPPFMDENVFIVFRKVMDEEPPSLKALRPQVSKGVDQMVQKCLEKEQEKRYPHVEDLKRAIEKAQKRGSALSWMMGIFLMVSLLSLAGYYAWKVFSPPKGLTKPSPPASLPQKPKHDKSKHDKPKHDKPKLPTPATCSDFYRLALAFMESKKFSEALEAFQKALALKPGDINSLYGEGNAYLLLSNLSKARESFEKILQKNPTNPGGYVGLGKVSVKEGDFKGALQNIEQALALNPKDLEGMIERGKVFLEMGEFEEALSNFRQLLKIHPKNPEGLYWRGLTHWKRGEKKKSLRDFQTHLKLSPQSSHKKEIEGYLGK